MDLILWIYGYAWRQIIVKVPFQAPHLTSAASTRGTWMWITRGARSRMKVSAECSSPSVYPIARLRASSGPIAADDSAPARSETLRSARCWQGASDSIGVGVAGAAAGDGSAAGGLLRSRRSAGRCCRHRCACTGRSRRFMRLLQPRQMDLGTGGRFLLFLQSVLLGPAPIGMHPALKSIQKGRGNVNQAPTIVPFGEMQYRGHVICAQSIGARQSIRRNREFGIPPFSAFPRWPSHAAFRSMSRNRIILQLHCVDGGSVEVAASELCRLSPVFRSMLSSDAADKASQTQLQVSRAGKEACSSGDSSPNQSPGDSTGAVISLHVDDSSKSWEQLLGLIDSQGFSLAGARSGNPPATATTVTWVRKLTSIHSFMWVHAQAATHALCTPS